MPCGMFSPVRKVSRISGLPSPLVSLKSVIRFADLSGRSARPGHSRVASTTKISPLGKTYAWRGLSKFSANKLTSNPGAGVGILLFGQPITFDVLRADGVVNGAGRASLSIGPVPGAKVISRESFCAVAQERVQAAITNNR